MKFEANLVALAGTLTELRHEANGTHALLSDTDGGGPGKVPLFVPSRIGIKLPPEGSRVAIDGRVVASADCRIHVEAEHLMPLPGVNRTIAEANRRRVAGGESSVVSPV